ncbi:MAG: hypothetical protein J6Q53_05400 [Oscillospiraceae bacterium]|nr:hypothetical protein [Oscillospiraceae bacterium]
MNMRNRFKIFRLVAIVMVLVLAMPMSVSAAVIEPVQPCASYYLDSYNAFVYPAGSGKVQVWFSVTGVNYMDELGALTIQLYESTDNSTWEWVDAYTHDRTSGMLSYDDIYHSGHVEYQGVAGRYYKAYVCIWGGKDGDGDTRYFWTSTKLAT